MADKEIQVIVDVATGIVIEEPLTPGQIAEREAWAAEEPARQRKAVEDARRGQYQLIADPLFFGFQRGDNTKEEWLDAVQAIKDANPYPSIES